MTRFGYFLSSEEYEPASLIDQATMAERAGFEALWISGHFHPRLDEQGQFSFVGPSSARSPKSPACGGRPVQGGIKGCWAPDAGQARTTMHRLWPNDSIPGESAQLLPLPWHFGQLAELVTEDMVSAPCGPDPEAYIKAIRAYEEAGFDEVYLGQVGGRLEGAGRDSQVCEIRRQPLQGGHVHLLDAGRRAAWSACHLGATASGDLDEHSAVPLPACGQANEGPPVSEPADG
jgi:hypothetical protein